MSVTILADPARERVRSDIVVDGVFDIEVTEWDRFLCAGLLTPFGFHAWDYRDEMSAVMALVQFEGTLWAHNGGRFDFNWLLDWCLRLGIDCTLYMAGGTIVRMRVGKLTLCDSARLVMRPLKEGCKLGRIDKLSTGLPCVCGRDCGGYCSFSRRPSVVRQVIAYMEYDCRAALSMLEELRVFAAHWDLDLAGTIGSASWKCARRHLDLPDADWTDDRWSAFTLYNDVREGYYGGRTQVGIPRAPIVYCQDVNSMYPYALSACPMPVGKRTIATGRKAALGYASGKDGIYQAIVHVPQMHIPPLPYRTKERIAYPYGRLTGSWTGIELRNAERLGCTVERIVRGIFWSDSKRIYSPLTQWYFAIRASVGTKSPYGKFMKDYSNAFSGKVAQRPETDSITICPTERPSPCSADADCAGGRLCSPSLGCCPHRCWRRCPRSIDKLQRVWVKGAWRLDPCAHVHHAAHLTSFGRIVVAEMWRGDDDGMSWAYGDTDSNKSVRELTHDPRCNALGGRKDEAPILGWNCLAPKTWAGIDGETGEAVAASKGIPDAARNFHLIGRGVPVAKGVVGIRGAARELDATGSLFRRKEVTRRIRSHPNRYGDRILGRDGRTHPQHVDALDA
jgi:hypothetical protein